ncbi:LysE family translocator [Pseudomonas frederiksbergensis]|uniref:Lysine transporter LysE n=1 Tax=Pseudomonas frederiksbergensis TaxID=104087 RepID=A0A423KFW8_9PSED|nr:LysE family translocator [Pseudomonas frederiksbergensis]RON51700.1 lysine transporter LysE [Pseudomonas frederiksbergensis]
MLSTFPTLLPFLLFAFVASITPGPTNILVLSNSARYGFKAALPIVFGACVSAATIVLLVGCGLGESFNRFPLLSHIFKWLGVVWLSYLAWQLYQAPNKAIESDSAARNDRRLGLWGAASLQLINPKTWTMAFAVVSMFAVRGDKQMMHTLYLSVLFFLVSIPCLGLWAALGSGSVRFLQSPKALMRFNRCLALVLLGSAWLSVMV